MNKRIDFSPMFVAVASVLLTAMLCVFGWIGDGIWTTGLNMRDTLKDHTARFERIDATLQRLDEYVTNCPTRSEVTKDFLISRHNAREDGISEHAAEKEKDNQKDN